MVERHAIIDAIEGSIFTLPDVPGVNTVLAIPGVAAMHGLMPSPEVNAVGKARLTEENVHATIEQVKEVFREVQKVCGWWVTPLSRPEDLADHLTQAGFAPVTQVSGMVLTNLNTPIATNPAIRVERVQANDLAGAAPMMARAYGMPEEAGTVAAQFMAGVMDHTEYWFYLGYLGDSEEPVAFSASLFLPGTPILVLQGAGTLPEYREQGMYHTMVARRLQDARERGMEAAVMQGNRETSAPIAEKLGFQELLPMTLYAWDPASSG
jgi:hypothetical protein